MYEYAKRKQMIMKKKLSVTIGIPAYNEEKNIRELLRCLLKQSKKLYRLEKIIIVSDGSTDATVRFATSCDDPVVMVIEQKNRLGQQVVQNILLRLNKSDVIILAEADTLPLHDHVIDVLVKPFLRKKSVVNPLGMVIGVPVPMPPRGIFEAILVQSSKIKSNIIYRWKKGNNIYAHSGHTMKALSGGFAKKLVYPADAPEDAFTYLTIKKYGYRFVISKDAKVGMRHVSTFAERIRQVRKYRTGRIAPKKYFRTELLNAEYTIPKILLAHSIAKALLASPLLTILYFVELVLNRLLTIRDNAFNAFYVPYTSSKQLFYENK